MYFDFCFAPIIFIFDSSGCSQRERSTHTCLPSLSTSQAFSRSSLVSSASRSSAHGDRLLQGAGDRRVSFKKTCFTNGIRSRQLRPSATLRFWRGLSFWGERARHPAWLFLPPGEVHPALRRCDVYSPVNIKWNALMAEHGLLLRNPS